MRRKFSLLTRAVFLALPAAASGQTWNTNLSGNWNVAGSWSPPAVPTSGITTALTFNNPFASTYTATNDIAGTFTLNSMTFNNSSNSALAIVNAAGSAIAFAGTNPGITMNGTGPVSISGTTLDVTGTLRIQGNGEGSLTIASQITGATGALLINRTSIDYTTITALTTSANTFGGGITLQAGHLSASVASSLGGGDLTVTTVGSGLDATGSFRTTASLIFPNSIVINTGATLNFLTGSTLQFNGGVSGQGGVTVGDGAVAGPTGANLNGPNTYTGPTIVNTTFLNLQGNAGSGTIASSSSVFIGRTATITLGGTTTFNTDRLGDNTPVALNGGTIAMVGSSTAGNNTNEATGAITFQGFPTLTADAQTSTAAAYTISNLVRAGNGVLRVRGDSLGNAAFPTNNTGNVLANQINGAAPASFLVGGGGGAGSFTRSIIPFAIGAATATGTGDLLVTYDSATGFRPLNTTTEVFGQLLPLSYADPATNYRTVNPSPAVNLALTVNSLQFVTTTGGNGIYGLGGNAPATTVTSGAVLASVNSFTGPLSFGSREGVLTAITNSLIVGGAVTGTGGATFSGANGGEVVLTTASPGLSGPTTINGGGINAAAGAFALIITNQVQLGAGAVTLNGGSLAVRGWTESLSTNIAVGPLGGGLRSQPIAGANAGTSSARSTTLNYTGALSGSGPFFLNGIGNYTQGGGGTITLAGNNAGYSGLMYLNGGTAVVGSDTALGTNSRLVIGSASTAGSAALQASASFTSSKTLIAAGSFEFIVPSAVNTLTMNGTLTAAAVVNITKTGVGTLAVTNQWLHSGTTVLGGDTTREDAGGTLRLTGAGALVRTSSVTINEGGLLLLDSSAGANSNNRVNDVNVTLAGGGFELRGNSATATSEGLGQLILPANAGGTVTVAGISPVNPSALALFATGGATSPFSRAAGSTVVFQSAGVLGNAATGQGRIHFVNFTPITPALLNNVLVGAFGFDSTGGGLVTLDAVSTGVVYVRPLTASMAGTFGVQTSFTGSTNVSNVILTANGSFLTIASAANALVVNPNISMQTNAALTLTTGNLVLGPSAIINGTGSLAADAGQDLSIFVPTGSANVSVAGSSGTGTLNKAGAGTLALQATSAFTGVNIHGGTITLIGGASLGPLTSLNVQSGATLQTNGQSLVVDQVGGQGTANLGAGTLTVGGTAANSDFGGALAAASLVKQGTGIFRFTHNATFSGPVTVNGGILAFGENSAIAPATPNVTGGTITFSGGTALFMNGVTTFSRAVAVTSGSVELDNGGQGGATTLASGINIAAGATLNVDTTTSGGFRINGDISGAGTLAINIGPLVLNGTNSHGATTIGNAGALAVVGSDSALGTGTVTFTAAGFILPGGGNRTLANNLDLAANPTFGPSAGLETVSNAFNLSFTGTTTLNGAAGQRTITTTGGGNYTLTAVTDGTATGVIKAGGGTLTMAGTNPYSGATNINAGTLVIAGTKTGTGAVSVGQATGAAGVLAGNGSIAGAVTVLATGAVAPGTTIGTITMPGSLAFNAAGTYFWELAANTTTGPGVNFDRIVVTGAATVAAGARVIPSFIGTATSPSAIPFWQTTQTWTDIITSSGTTGASLFAIDNTAWSTLGNFNTVLSGSNGVSLVWTPVPEPASLLLLGGAALGVRMRRRLIARR